jgi:hypothetical protein
MTTLAPNTPVTSPAKLRSDFPWKFLQTNTAQGSEGQAIQAQLSSLCQPTSRLQDQQEKLKGNLVVLLKNQEVNQALYELSLEIWRELSHTLQRNGCFLPIPQVCPGSSNNLMYTWSLDRHYLECEIFDSGEVEFFYRNRSTGETWGEDILSGQHLSREILQKANLFTV